METSYVTMAPLAEARGFVIQAFMGALPKIKRLPAGKKKCSINSDAGFIEDSAAKHR